jgi:rubrerythrin
MTEAAQEPRLKLAPLHKAQTFEEAIQRQTVSTLLDHINNLLSAYRTAGESAVFEEGLSIEEIKALLESNTEQLKTALYGAVAAWATSAPEVAAKAKEEGALYITHSKKREIEGGGRRGKEARSERV